MAASPNVTAQVAPSAAASAPAKADEGVKLDTVVITARKRAESIDTVPLAVTAMPAAKIEERNLKAIEDVAAFTPGFYTQSVTGTGTGRNDRSFRQLTFRGIGASSTNIGPLAGGVGFLDGAPVLNSSLSNVQDLERVEVLRGPQGVYFGRSTFIGAVNYITKDPTEKFTGRLTGEYGQADLVDLSASISGALIPDMLSARVSARHYQKGGQYYTSNENVRVGDQSTESVSLTTLFKPLSNLKVRTFFNRFEDDDGPPAQYTLGGKSANGGSNCNLGGTGGPYYCGQVPQKPDPSRISADLQLSPALVANLLQGAKGIPVPFDYSTLQSKFGLRRDANQFSNKIEYYFDSGITLTAVTAIHNEQMVTLNDVAFVATPNQYTTAVGYEDHDWSQEIRATSSAEQKLRWTAGANYVRLLNTTSGIPAQFPPFGYLNFGQGQVGYTAARTPAVFAGVYYDLLPKLTLTVESRYQQDKLIGHYYAAAVAPNPAGFVSVDQTYDSFSPRISVDYKLTPTEIVYLLASRGYKPGGFNQGILTQPQFVLNQFASTGASAIYNQEKLDNYEAGIKGSFLDGKVRMALNGYLGRYTSAQVPIPVAYYTTQNADGTPNTSGPLNTVTLTRNVGVVNLKGLEFESEALVAAGWRIGGTFAYTGTKIKNYGCGECLSILAQNATFNPATGANSIGTTSTIGKRLPGAPQIAFTLSSNYEREVMNGIVGRVGGDFIYRGSYFAEAANIASSGSSKTFNLRLGGHKGNYDLEFFARNLFDNQSPTIAWNNIDYASGGVTANQVRIGLPDRRRLGVRGNVTF